MSPTFSSAWMALGLVVSGCTSGWEERLQARELAELAVQQYELARIRRDRAECERDEARLRAELAEADLAEAKARAEIREIAAPSPNQADVADAEVAQ